MVCLNTYARTRRSVHFLSLFTIYMAVLFQLRTGMLVEGFEGSGDSDSDILYGDKSIIEDPILQEQARINLSRTLKRIVEYPNYDKSLRPGIGGPPVHVKADIFCLSIGPIIEVDMEYHLDVFFRQRWTDPRLAYDDPYPILSLNTIMLESIWYPDTYFHNGKKSYGHSITTANRLFRIGPNGTVLYTQRLTIVAECKMHFQNYPMDSQVCPLEFGSNSFSTEDIIYEWHEDKVKYDPNVSLSQFDFLDITTKEIVIPSMKIGNRSALIAKFYLQRRIGYFLIQIYVPSILITVLSWVSFWLNPEATPARVALGVMTILTITTLGWSIRDDLPKVSYAKALDWYLALCFTFVLGSLVEFAAATYLSKRHLNAAEEHRRTEHDEDQIQMMPLSGCKKRTRYGGTYQPAPRTTTEVIYEDSVDEETCCDALVHCVKGNTKYKEFKFSRSCSMSDTSKIDRICRRAFPMSFIFLNVLYWIAYLRAGESHL